MSIWIFSCWICLLQNLRRHGGFSLASVCDPTAQYTWYVPEFSLMFFFFFLSASDLFSCGNILWPLWSHGLAGSVSGGTSVFLFNLAHLSSHSARRCVEIVPEHNSGVPVELGKEFTATCLLHHKDLKADNIVWSYGVGAQVILPKEYYRKINESAGSITVNVTRDMEGFFKCTVANHETMIHSDCSYIYGILLDKGCELTFLLIL